MSDAPPPTPASLAKRSIAYALIGVGTAPGLVALFLFRLLLSGRRGIDPAQFSFHHPAMIAGMACLLVAAVLLIPALILLRLARQEEAAAKAEQGGG